MRKLGFGLIGVGHHGIRYARHLHGDVPGARLVAVCRRDRNRGQAIAREFEARYYEDYQRLLDDPDVEAVVIVSPTGRHLEMALAAADRGRAVLLEKPIGTTAAEGDRILEAFDARGVRLMVAQTLRFEPAAVAFRTFLPTIGRVRALVFQHRSRDVRLADGRPEDPADVRGVLLDTGVHYFDLLDWLCPGRLDRVRCEVRRYERRHSEDAFAALLAGPDLLATVDVCRATPARHETWVAAGETGILEVDRFRVSVRRVSAEGAEDLPVPAPAPTLPRVLTSFIHSLETGEPFEVPGRAARNAVAIAEACMESATRGRTVRLDSY